MLQVYPVLCVPPRYNANLTTLFLYNVFILYLRVNALKKSGCLVYLYTRIPTQQHLNKPLYVS